MFAYDAHVQRLTRDKIKKLWLVIVPPNAEATPGPPTGKVSRPDIKRQEYFSVSVARLG